MVISFFQPFFGLSVDGMGRCLFRKTAWLPEGGTEYGDNFKQQMHLEEVAKAG
jgi:hypothetical protein